MRELKELFKKEWLGYFYSPVAYVFIVIFLFSTVGTTFFLGHFFASNQASLELFFMFHPWLYLFLIPALGMGLWAEERAQGSIELLLTLPISLTEAVLAKFLAAWAFVGLALFLTFPMVFTVLYLGQPDKGVMLTGYLGSFLMGGAYLAIASFTSALTRNQVISFIVTVMVCFTLVLSGWGVFVELLSAWLPTVMVELISNFSFTTHFMNLGKGIVDLRDLIFFFSVMVAGLLLTALVLEKKRGNE